MLSEWFVTDANRHWVAETSIHYSYDYGVVFLSLVVAALASYTAFHLLARISEASRRFTRLVWYAIAALSMGCGIWAMHFIAMLAMHLPHPVLYEIRLTVASVVFAVLASGLSFFVVVNSTRIASLMAGSVALGFGIGGMHYTGMAAMHLGAEIRYDLSLVALSIGIAVALSFVALRVLSGDLQRQNAPSHRRRIVNGCIMGSSIAAMHYTGMAATYIVPDQGTHAQATALNGSIMAIAVALAALSLVALALAVSVVEQALGLRRLRAQVNEQSLNAIVEYVGEAIITTDAEGRIESLNPAAARIFGYERAEILGATILKLIPTRKPRKRTRGSTRSTIQADRLIGRTRRMIGQRKGGVFFDVDVSVSEMKVDGERKLIGVCRDVTAEKVAENALRESEKRVRAVMENVGEAILVIDEQGTIESVNPAAEKIFGYQTGELIGRNVRCLMPSPDAERHDGYIRSYLDTGVAKMLGVEGREVVGARKDGSTFPATLSVREMHVDGKRSFIGAMRDITRQKEAEDALVAHRDHLAELVEQKTADLRAQAAKLAEALDAERKLNELQQEFVSMASHELRTPLAIIDGSAQRIIRRKDQIPPDELKERVEKIRSAVARMTGLVDRTLDASRFNAGMVEVKLEDVDLKKLVSKVCDRQRDISPNHAFTIDLEGLPSVITGDYRLLEQVFTNLVSNAVKYSRIDPSIRIQGYTDGDFAGVRIRDNGVGIPEKDLPRLFERYFRAGTAIGIPGTGIGLNLVKQLVDLHNGSISLESVEGRGSTFTVRLPINMEESASVAATPASGGGGGGASEAAA